MLPQILLTNLVFKRMALKNLTSKFAGGIKSKQFFRTITVSLLLVTVELHLP